MASKLYSTPIVVRSTTGDWFVFFRFWNQVTNKYHSIKCREDLNRIKDPQEKDAEFKALREARELWLKMGWNPLTDRNFEARKQAETHQFAHIKEWTVEKCLLHAVANKKMATKSRYDYKKSAEYFIEAARPMYIHAMLMKDLEKRHIKAVFNSLLQDFKLSNKNYNKRLEHLKSLLTELVDWEVFTHNPAFGLKNLHEEETQKFVPLDAEERAMLREYLYLENYQFYIYCITIYYTGIRPDEILSLRIKDLDLKNSTLHLAPFSNVVKNKKERRKAVHSKLLRFYQEMQLDQLPDTWYIFSKNFKPGPEKLHRRVATGLWKRLVWNELGIEKYLYSLKHTGADDLIEAGVSEDFVKDHLGHSTKFMTRRYTQKGIEASKKAVLAANIEF